MNFNQRRNFCLSAKAYKLRLINMDQRILFIDSEHLHTFKALRIK